MQLNDNSLKMSYYIKLVAATLKAISFMATVARQVFLVTDPAAAEMFETVYAETFRFNRCLRLPIPVHGAF